MNSEFTTSAINNTKQPLSKIDSWFKMLPLEKFFNNKPNIPVIRLSGVISSSSMRSNLSFESLNKIIKQAFDTTKLEAVCLIVNSPGGSPVQSELIAKRIRHLADEKNIPVYAFVEDVAASGGYWLACAADEIYASISSIIGSIGVVSQGFGFNDAISKLGIERRVYTSGKNKSILDPFMPEKQGDIKILKSIQNEIHNHFIEYVKSRRKHRLTQSDDILFNGEFWTGKTAVDFGLIDGIDDLESFVYNKYGSSVNIKYIEPKKSWFKNKLGLSLNGEEIVNQAISSVENKLEYQKFGINE